MSTITYDVARTPARTTTGRRSLLKDLLKRWADAIAASRMRAAEEHLRRYRHLLPSELEQAAWKLTERSEDSLPFVR